MTWCIVDTDNFVGDYPNESFIATGISSKETAEIMAEALNKNHHAAWSMRWYKVCEEPYKLAPGFEP